MAHSFLATSSPADIDWKTWAVQESLRRTLFLIYIIHELLHVAETLDDAYFEPVFADRDVHQHMALPASDALWRADTEEEWMEARRAAADETSTEYIMNTPQKFGDMHRLVAARDVPWVLTEFPLLPEITRLILSVGPIYSASKRCTHPKILLS